MAIRAALGKEGFHWRLAMRKPPISERNRVIRLQLAQEHVNWTQPQWNSILLTDETWITGGRHTHTWVAPEGWRRVGPYLHSRKAPEKKGMGVLGLFSW